MNDTRDREAFGDLPFSDIRPPRRASDPFKGWPPADFVPLPRGTVQELIDFEREEPGTRAPSPSAQAAD